MAKYNIDDMSGEEIFLRKQSPDLKPAEETKVAVPVKETVPVREEALIVKSVGFEASVNSFSSKDTVKKRRKKRKRALGVDGILRLVAICVCIGIFSFSLLKIGERVTDLAAAKEAYDSLNAMESDSLVSHPKPVRRIPTSKDLLSYLGSDKNGIDILDTNTQNYYETLREKVLSIQKDYPDCIGYITVSDTKISYPLMKTDNNQYYLRYLYNGVYSTAGSIFADCDQSDDYDKNMNTVIYGHCMSDGSMFRGIKYFFDSENRYTRAQDMEITVVTADGVYIYEYFSGYRAEGARFISKYIDDGKNTSYYNFLKNIRALNTIPKNVAYNANSKIVTLVTCTNLAAKPNERYVLHGILTKHFTFE